MANVKTDIIEGLGEQQSQHTIQYAFCQKSCIDQTDMLLTHQPSHVIEDNNSNEDIYQCNICLKTFTVLARLTRHYRTHTGEKPFQCEFCSKSFSVKENLSVHRRIHTKERPYKCEICSRAFEHSGKLHRHMRIHTGERPHKCTICEKTFIQSGQLVIHMRTHTGEKPYVCTTCKKGFTCSKQLKVHSRTHTGEKPYSCDICGKSFGYNHVLKLHQVAHYGEKVYKCTICKDTFTSKKFMEMHIKNHSDNTNHIHQSSTQECAIVGEIQKSEAQVNKNIYENSAINRKENVGLRYVLQQPKLENQQSDKHLYNLLTHPHEFKQDLGTIALKSPVHVSVPVVYDRSEDSISNSNQQHQLLTPPSSNSSSPAGSPVMQQMVDLEAEDDQHNLPLRKRSKMFLKSFEAISSIPTVQLPNDVRNSQVPIRYNTVIHYAKAS